MLCTREQTVRWCVNNTKGKRQTRCTLVRSRLDEAANTLGGVALQTCRIGVDIEKTSTITTVELLRLGNPSITGTYRVAETRAIGSSHAWSK